MFKLLYGERNRWLMGLSSSFLLKEHHMLPREINNDLLRLAVHLMRVRLASVQSRRVNSSLGVETDAHCWMLWTLWTCDRRCPTYVCIFFRHGPDVYVWMVHTRNILFTRIGRQHRGRSKKVWFFSTAWVLNDNNNNKNYYNNYRYSFCRGVRMESESSEWS